MAGKVAVKEKCAARTAISIPMTVCAAHAGLLLCVEVPPTLGNGGFINRIASPLPIEDDCGTRHGITGRLGCAADNNRICRDTGTPCLLAWAQYASDCAAKREGSIAE